MSNEYRKALSLAYQSDITGALNALYRQVEMPHNKGEKTPQDKMLYGFCLYRFGDYERAYDNLKDFPEYADEAKAALLRFRELRDQITVCLKENKPQKAMDAYKRLHNGSANEKNIEGCLRVLCKDVKGAKKCFVEALLLDKGSKRAVELLETLSTLSANGLEDMGYEGFSNQFADKILRKIKGVFKSFSQ